MLILALAVAVHAANEPAGTVGRKDLQQCADSILRLWAEWQHLPGADLTPP